MKNHTLLAIDGRLYFPDSLPDPAILLRRYPAGDCDTIPWPLESNFRPLGQLRYDLAVALYDERECNPEFSHLDTVTLPDGERFYIDYELAEGQNLYSDKALGITGGDW